jgi:hypothetical protein
MRWWVAVTLGFAVFMLARELSRWLRQRATMDSGTREKIDSLDLMLWRIGFVPIGAMLIVQLLGLPTFRPAAVKIAFAGGAAAIWIGGRAFIWRRASSLVAMESDQARTRLGHAFLVELVGACVCVAIVWLTIVLGR